MKMRVEDFLVSGLGRIEPGALLDVEDLASLERFVATIDRWDEYCVNLFDYVYRGLVARALVLGRAREEILALHEHIRSVRARLKANASIGPDVHERWGGYAAVLDARFGCLDTSDTEAVMRMAITGEIIAALEGNGQMSRSAIAAMIQRNECELARAIARMEDHGIVLCQWNGDELNVRLRD